MAYWANRARSSRSPLTSLSSFVARRAFFGNDSALGEGPRSIHVGPREREDATPTREVSVLGDRALARSHAPRALAWSPPPITRRRAGRCDTNCNGRIRSLPELSDSSRLRMASAPTHLRPVLLASDPRDTRNRQPVAMSGVHPITPLARPPLAWGLGPARVCERRAPRDDALQRRAAVPPDLRPGFSTTETRAGRKPPSRG